MKKISFERKSTQPYEHLDLLVDFLIDNGNKLSKNHRWGESRAGFFCLLEKPIDFDAIKREFVIPSYIRLIEGLELIECDRSWAFIKGNVSNAN